MAKQTHLDSETTISVNGGPAVPLQAAMDRMAAVVEGREATLNTETNQLMCRLTDDEQRVRGVELADTEAKLRELAEEKADIAARIKWLEATRDKLAETVKHKQEERPVACSLHPDYEADSMTIRRTDTGEIVSVRQLTHAERQPSLPGTEA